MPAEFAHIGKSLNIKGELSGSEDLYVDGVVEGSIELTKNNLVIGRNGQVRANVHAKGVVIEGKVEGNIRATECTELRKTAVATADILTQRIVVEDGALLIGKVNVQPEGAKSTAKAVEAQAEAKPSPAPPRSAGSSAGKS
ncbi:MAG TPA: polymer-forming cytoskeletal protein [Terriglobales bacterium]|nr:polymer-forming cytoskeletal protein [Terriglobales bacterium]